MTFSSLEAHPTRNGKWTAWVIGQPNDHIMDWRGCNFKQLRVPGIGPESTVEALVEAIRKRYPTQHALQNVIADRTGSYFPEQTPKQFAESGKRDMRNPWLN